MSSQHDLDALAKIAGGLAANGNLALADFKCREILDAAPDHVPALNIEGVIAAYVGRLDQAIAYFEKALSLQPSNTAIRNNLERLKAAPEPPPPAEPRYLLIKSWGFGFWADVHQVMGALLLAEVAGRILAIHWGKNSHFSDQSDGDSFRHYFEPVSEATIETFAAMDGLTIFPPKWSRDTLGRENHHKWSGENSCMAGIYFLGQPEALTVCDYFVGIVDLAPWIPRGHPLAGKSIDELHRHVADKYLKPRAHVLAAVKDFERQHLAGRDVVAVHVRGSDKQTEFVGLDDLNRSYFELLDREEPKALIFLLTEDARWAEAFRERYGARVIMTDSCRTSSETGVHWGKLADPVRLGTEVLVDALLAMRCPKFIGNGRSNVSAMVAMLKAWPEGTCTLVAPSQLYERKTKLHGDVR